MDQSTTLDIEALKMTQEQYVLASQSIHLQRPGCDAVYPVGLYGWRKRCLYFFLLLLLVIMIVNLALTVWIIKVMNFTVNGMGDLQVSRDGIRLEGISEFLLPLYVNEIQSRKDSPLVLRAESNVTLNARNSQGQLTGQLTVDSEAVEVQCQRLVVRSSNSERLLFSATEEQVSIGTDKLTVTGAEGAVFGHSVETPLIQAVASQDLKLESPTRTLTMEAPRGVEVSARTGGLKALCRKDLHLQSTEGEIFLDAAAVRLETLPLGTYAASSGPSSSSPRAQKVYEVCVCPSGKLYLSPAESSSTCQAVGNICLWS
ncbi:zeta-sarcoglycan isoform X1 [Osmerus eperlanus]|uniref:zeta-sarcoglycan isoform X1 n=1 Tax=Osmerus eperlanus TaxID=29151 RepID=UPI002E159D83